MAKKLYITDDYLYYRKKYQKGKYVGVHNWKHLRKEVQKHAGGDEEYINEQTHESYGFIYCDKYEYDRIVGNSFDNDDIIYEDENKGEGIDWNNPIEALKVIGFWVFILFLIALALNK